MSLKEGILRMKYFYLEFSGQIHALGLKASCMNLSENSRYKYFVSPVSSKNIYSGKQVAA